MPGSLPPNWHPAQGRSVLEGGEFTSLDAHCAIPTCRRAKTSALACSFY